MIEMQNNQDIDMNRLQASVRNASDIPPPTLKEFLVTFKSNLSNTW